ncbi:hypothetical protein DLM78_17505 [Leptospira stimsonii]|uniref:Uncharacterized protein n=1 Tax=Leptospira stimsonii TaxID=2202203 RepID=A0A8B3CNV8_9LEPT|nr:hypothetical protein DLM78_17505 [Leptospira stimsonii]
MDPQTFCRNSSKRFSLSINPTRRPKSFLDFSNLEFLKNFFSPPLRRNSYKILHFAIFHRLLFLNNSADFSKVTSEDLFFSHVRIDRVNRL